MTDELDESTERRFLLARPQPLGILPSLWFWNQSENWRLVRWPFAMLAMLLVVTQLVLLLPPVAYAAASMLVFFLALGSLEKYIRNQALTRRALAEASADAPALAPAAEAGASSRDA